MFLLACARAPLSAILQGGKGVLMAKKKDDIHDYCTAGEAAEMLSEKFGRVIRPDYISKMAKSRKRTIRRVKQGNRWAYHREDIAACTVRALSE